MVSESVVTRHLAEREPAGFGGAIEAVVLSGTHQNPRRLVNGRNKAFLEIDGRPLVRHVVDALRAARHISEIFVVGPADELASVLSDCPEVYCVPQEGKLLSNGWAAIRAVEARREQQAESDSAARPVLLVSCDLPLASPAAIDDFVERAAQVDAASGANNAMLVGIADEPGLKPFYGAGAEQGIVRPLVQMQEGLFRLSNIYVSRPRNLQHSEFLQTSFSYRKAKDWHNVAKLVFSLFRQPGGWFAAWMTCRLQLTAMLRHGKGRWYRRLRAGNTLTKVERGVSTVLGGPVRIVVTPYGGLSLDVDDEEDFRLLEANYERWSALGAAELPADESSQQGQGKPGPEGDQSHGQQ